MSDLKSKLPDLNEITSITSKLFKDLKTSVSEIIDDYKARREPVKPPEKKKTQTATSKTKSTASSSKDSTTKKAKTTSKAPDKKP